jgi:hypothetical protein
MKFSKFAEFLSKHTNYVVILRGIHGAGKTFFARQLRDQIGAERVSILSFDDYFTDEDGKYDFDPKEMDHAVNDLFGRCLEATDETTDKIVIIDHTNIFAHEISPYIMAATSAHIPYGVVSLHTDLPLAVANNSKKITDSRVVDSHRDFLRETLPSRWHRFEFFSPKVGGGSGSSSAPSAPKRSRPDVHVMGFKESASL